jgi:hypothetical protein
MKRAPTVRGVVLLRNHGSGRDQCARSIGRRCVGRWGWWKLTLFGKQWLKLKLRDETWEEVALSAAYSCQCDSLH